MVSQRLMHRTCLLACGRILLGAALFFGGACSQGEGERCQVDSDCSGALYCERGESGNGLCKSAETRNDAAVPVDAREAGAADAPVDAAADAADRADGPADAGAPGEVAVDLAPFTPVDADDIATDVPAGSPDLALDTGSLDGAVVPLIDAEAIDSASFDTGAID
jgi:hypothetical protein